eukprot:2981216-Alexandrium_andersonii.AAC.1
MAAPLPPQAARGPELASFRERSREEAAAAASPRHRFDLPDVLDRLRARVVAARSLGPGLPGRPW